MDEDEKVEIGIRIYLEKDWYLVQKYLKNIGFLWNSEILDMRMGMKNSGLGFISKYHIDKWILLCNLKAPRLKFGLVSKSISVNEFLELYYPFFVNEKENHQKEFIEKVYNYVLNSKGSGNE